MRPMLSLCAVAGAVLLVVQAPAAPVKTAADLAKVFDRDAARGFAEAQRLFDARKAADDYAGMMEIVRLVGPWAEWARVPGAFDPMATPAIAAAEARGKWADAGDVYVLRSLVCFVWQFFTDHPIQDTPRGLYCADQALACYKKAGVPPPDMSAWVRSHPATSRIPIEKRGQVWDYAALAAEMKAQTEKTSPGFRWYENHIRNVSGPWQEALRAAAEAKRTCQDTQVAGRLKAIVDDALAQDMAAFSFSQTCVLVGMIPCFGYFPGADVEAARASVFGEYAAKARGNYIFDLHEDYVWGYLEAWNGRDDLFLDRVRWYVDFFRAADPPPNQAIALSCTTPIVQKLWKLGRVAEATDAAAACRNVAPKLNQQWQDSWGSWAARFALPGMPSELYESLLATTRVRCVTKSDPSSMVATLSEAVELCSMRPACNGHVIRLANWLLDAAPEFTKAEDRSALAAAAADAMECIGRPDLAQGARELAVAFSEGKPEAVLKAAVGAAANLATAGTWDSAEATLTRALATPGVTPCGAQLDCLLLLSQAQQHRGADAEARATLARAAATVDGAGLAAPERANYLVGLSQLVADASQRADLLKRALAAAREAKLDLLEQAVADQVAASQLDMGDLPAARTVLEGLVDRLEEKRGGLAFDPQLRQQWFADNIGPYRKLMRVAALQDDAALALRTAERMRSRVLIDQLSWQKVDMGLSLSPAEQQRLTQLRALRSRAYGLLQQATSGVTAGTDTRGSYLPIRGYYMPIRGTLDSGKVMTTEQVQELRSALTSLQQEETALESAIRAAVPAYADAGNTRIPSAQETLSALDKHPDLAVLHYTFADDGLVAIALRSGKAPKVAYIREPGDKVWERVGQFRQAIWERKPEAFTQASELYQTLVSPVADVIKGAKRLWVIGDGAIQLVPFGALIDDNHIFIGYNTAVATAPSLCLALSSRGQREKPAQSALIVAAPDTGAEELAAADTRGRYLPIRGMYLPLRGAYMPIRGDGGVSSALTAMASVPLPGAKAEGEAIAALVPGARLVTGKDATKTMLLADGGACGILHIATHGYADPDFPEFSGVLLANADGSASYDVLTAQDVYTWPLKARVVALSACQTALGKDVQGEGLLGLSRAFLYAGAQDVLCSLWPVSDETTKILMAWFYHGLMQGLPVEEALQAAQKQLIDHKASNHPFFWAGFEAVRGPE